MSVCPSIHKSFCDFNQIFVEVSDLSLNSVINGMLYDPIQDQCHGGPKVVKTTDFRVYLLCQYACNEMTNDEL